MGFTLTPVVIAAITTAALALLLVLIVITRKLLQHQRHTPRSTHTPHLRGEIATPSTGHTALVTPSQLKKGWSASSPSNPDTGADVRTPITSPYRPDSDVLVVTYEEGLAKLGLAQIPERYSADPPPFDVARQAYPVIPLSPRRPTRPPSRSESRSWSRAGSTETVLRTPTPLAASVGSIGADEGVESKRLDGGSNGRLQSTWLPSYYHSPVMARTTRTSLEDSGNEDYRGVEPLAQKTSSRQAMRTRDRYGHRI